jgi:hypothetical protein
VSTLLLNEGDFVKKIIIFLSSLSVTGLISLVGSLTLASQFTLPQLDPSQVEPIFKVLAADMAFRPVQPASGSSLFGISLGVTGFQASTSPSTILSQSTSQVYDGDINGSISLPFGLGVEAGFIPNSTVSGTNINRFGIDAKWTFTDLFFSLPFNAALRGFYTTGGLSYTQPLNGGTVNVNYNTVITGGQLSVSKKILFLEPYVSYGYLQQSSSLSGSGSSSLFNSNYPAGTTSISSVGTTGWFQAGVQVRILILTLAAEYDNLFGADSVAGRVAFAF